MVIKLQDKQYHVNFRLADMVHYTDGQKIQLNVCVMDKDGLWNPGASILLWNVTVDKSKSAKEFILGELESKPQLKGFEVIEY